MQSLLGRIKSFVASIVHLTQESLGFILIGAIPWFLDISDLYDRFIRPFIPFAPPLTNDRLVSLSIAIAILAVLWSYHRLRIAHVNLEETYNKRLSPALEILYVPGDMPYLQKGEALHRDLGKIGLTETYRVVVKNASLSTVQDIRPSLSRIRPQALYPPLRLHLMHDNVPAPHFKTEFTLNPGDEQPVDVIQYILMFDGNVSTQILHAVENIEQFVPSQTYEFEIRVTAKDVPEIVRRFRSGVQEGEVFFKPIT